MTQQFTWNEGLVIFVIVFIVLFIAFPLSFRLFNTKIQLTLDFSTAPVIGVIFLVATTAIPIETVWEGIRGDASSHILPWTVLIVFFSLAYVCISWDLSGVFEWIALKVLQYGGSSGWKIFIYYFFLASFLTLFTSNDIVILTITPIICYFCNMTGSNPDPYLFSQFYAANIWSIAILVSNPTNIIAGEAYQMTFLSYMIWMVLPAVAGGITCLALLALVFRNSIPSELNSAKIALELSAKSENTLRDVTGAFFGTILMSSLMILMVCTTWFPQMEIWMICLSGFVVKFTFDFTRDLYAYLANSETRRLSLDRLINNKKPVGYQYLQQPPIHSPVKSKPIQNRTNVILDESSHLLTSPNTTKEERNVIINNSTTNNVHYRSLEINPDTPVSNSKQNSIVFSGSNTNNKPIEFPASPDITPSSSRNVSLDGSEGPSVQMQRATKQQQEINENYLDVNSRLSDTTSLSSMSHFVSVHPSLSLWTLRGQNPLYSVKQALSRMPWKIAPFVISMFILVEGMNRVGIVGLLATGCAKLAWNDLSSILLITTLTTLACNIINNQPMTILFAQVLLHPNFSEHTSLSAQKAAHFGLVIGSNYGANLTLIGALAGLMWMSILGRFKIPMSYGRFLSYGLIFVAPVLVTTCITFWLEQEYLMPTIFPDDSS